MLDRDPDEPFPSNICVGCHKPIDDHCLRHGPHGLIICPGLNGKTPCEMTGPKAEAFI